MHNFSSNSLARVKVNVLRKMKHCAEMIMPDYTKHTIWQMSLFTPGQINRSVMQDNVIFVPICLEV